MRVPRVWWEITEWKKCREASSLLWATQLMVRIFIQVRDEEDGAGVECLLYGWIDGMDKKKGMCCALNIAYSRDWIMSLVNPLEQTLCQNTLHCCGRWQVMPRFMKVKRKYFPVTRLCYKSTCPYLSVSISTSSVVPITYLSVYFKL